MKILPEIEYSPKHIFYTKQARCRTVYKEFPNAYHKNRSVCVHALDTYTHIQTCMYTKHIHTYKTVYKHVEYFQNTHTQKISKPNRFWEGETKIWHEKGRFGLFFNCIYISLFYSMIFYDVHIFFL